jgi:hypothetical protein
VEAAAVSLRLPSDDREVEIVNKEKEGTADSLILLYKGHCESPYYLEYQG